MSVSIRGIASGLDINKIIAELMYLERAPLRRIEAQIKQAEALQELWRGVGMRIDALRRSLEPLLYPSTFNARTLSYGNSQVITANLTGAPLTGHYIFEVEQLATRHRVAMKEALCTDPDAPLGLAGTFYLGTGKAAEGLSLLVFDPVESGWLQGNFSAGYHVVVDGDAATTLPLVVEQIAFREGIEGEVSEVRFYLERFEQEGEERLTILQDYYAAKDWDGDIAEPLLYIRKDEGGVWRFYGPDGEAPFAFQGDHPLGRMSFRVEAVGTGDTVLMKERVSFTVRQDGPPLDRMITVNETDSLNEIAQRINGISQNTGVRALVVKKTDGDYRLVLESLVEGKAGSIQTWSYRPRNYEEEQVYGKDRVLQALGILADEENGVFAPFTGQLQEAGNARFSFNGLQLERSSNRIDDLLAGVTFQLHGPGSGTVSVVQDTEAIISKIAAFVNAYNETLSMLRSLQSENGGLPAHDLNLMRIEHRFRSLVQSVYNSLAQVGITTSGKEGYLQIDRAALRSAVIADVQSVFGLFGGPEGLARKLREYTSSLVGFNGFISTRQSHLQRSIQRLEQNIESWEYRLAKREQHLIRQFTFMEQYIARMMQQNSFFFAFEQMLRREAGE